MHTPISIGMMNCDPRASAWWRISSAPSVIALQQKRQRRRARGNRRERIERLRAFAVSRDGGVELTLPVVRDALVVVGGSQVRIQCRGALELALDQREISAE